MPFSIKNPAISMVCLDVFENLKIPVSWAIPVYRHSATALLIFPLSRRRNTTSLAELAQLSITLTLHIPLFVMWWSTQNVSFAVSRYGAKTPRRGTSLASDVMQRSNVFVSSYSVCTSSKPERKENFTPIFSRYTETSSPS